MQNIVITGGCGFIGVNLIRFLIKTDESVCIRVVDNLSVGQLEDLNKVCTFQMIKAEELTSWDNRATLVVGDIQDAKLADSVCQGADGVVHLAANTGVIPSIEDPMADCMANVIGTLNYLEAASLGLALGSYLAWTALKGDASKYGFWGGIPWLAG